MTTHIPDYQNLKIHTFTYVYVRLEHQKGCQVVASHLLRVQGTDLNFGFSARARQSLDHWAISLVPNICEMIFAADECTVICVFWVCGRVVCKWIVPLSTVLRSPPGWYLPLITAEGGWAKRFDKSTWTTQLDSIPGKQNKQMMRY